MLSTINRVRDDYHKDKVTGEFGWWPEAVPTMRELIEVGTLAHAH